MRGWTRPATALVAALLLGSGAPFPGSPALGSPVPGSPALGAPVLGSGRAADAGSGPPARPVDLAATNGMTSIGLTWRQPATGSRPLSFRVYENGTVVARNTTTHVTVPDLAFGSTHTYQVTAVDSAGRESAPSAPVTRKVFAGGPIACGITAPSGLTVTGVTSSAVSLAWSSAVPYYDLPGTIVVLLDDAVVLQTTVDSARIGGLAPGSTHTLEVARKDCQGQLHRSGPVTVTTPPGPAPRPGRPSGATVGARTATSIALTWTGVPQATGYAVYEGGTRVATTATPGVVLRGLWRDTRHQYTVAALDAAAGESAHTDPVLAATLPCPDSTVRPPAVNPPTDVRATAVSPSSVALTWTQTFQATSFTVYDLGGPTPRPIATSRSTSAMITGLPSGATATVAVVAETAACGPSPMSAPATATTPAGPAARPAAPTDLRVVSSTPNFDFTGTVSLAWSGSPAANPPAGYRLYEGTTVLAAATDTAVTLLLPGGPTHAVTAVAVDAAGNESAQSNQILFPVPFLPPP